MFSLNNLWQSIPNPQPQLNPFGQSVVPQPQPQFNPLGQSIVPQPNPFGQSIVPQPQPQLNPLGQSIVPQPQSQPVVTKTYPGGYEWKIPGKQIGGSAVSQSQPQPTSSVSGATPQATTPTTSTAPATQTATSASDILTKALESQKSQSQTQKENIETQSSTLEELARERERIAREQAEAQRLAEQKRIQDLISQGETVKTNTLDELLSALNTRKQQISDSAQYLLNQLGVRLGKVSSQVEAGKNKLEDALRNALSNILKQRQAKEAGLTRQEQTIERTARDVLRDALQATRDIQRSQRMRARAGGYLSSSAYEEGQRRAEENYTKYRGDVISKKAEDLRNVAEVRTNMNEYYDTSVANAQATRDSQVKELDDWLRNETAAIEADKTKTEAEKERQVMEAENYYQQQVDKVDQNFENWKNNLNAEMKQANIDIDSELRKGVADLNEELARIGFSKMDRLAAIDATLSGREFDIKTALANIASASSAASGYSLPKNTFKVLNFGGQDLLVDSYGNIVRQTPSYQRPVVEIDPLSGVGVQYNPMSGELERIGVGTLSNEDEKKKNFWERLGYLFTGK